MSDNTYPKILSKSPCNDDLFKEASHRKLAGIVADEIRKLAENSGTEAKMISVVLSNIKKLIDSTFSKMGIVQKEMERIFNEFFSATMIGVYAYYDKEVDLVQNLPTHFLIEA